MKEKTKISLIIAILFGIFVAFFETKTEWLVSHIRDIERDIEAIKYENKYFKEELNYISNTFDISNDSNLEY